jgi:biotin synthase
MKRKIRASIGSLGALGLRDIKLPAPPTTVYLMVGERCVYDCAYCSQALNSEGSIEQLSRVIWPEVEWQELKAAIKDAPGFIKRVCFQVVNSRGFLEDVLFFIREIKDVSFLPVSVSVRVSKMEDLEKLFTAGVERVGIALDVATETTYSRYRGGDFKKTVDLILRAGGLFKGRITTHIIVGMSETDRELYDMMKKMFDNRITVGLFAFTPVKGTCLEGETPPSLTRYRRIQLVRYLLSRGVEFLPEFGEAGNLISMDIVNRVTLVPGTSVTLLGGWAVRDMVLTSGCVGCNRPYYNEKPLGPMFNYPFQPKEAEEKIVGAFVEGMEDIGKGRVKIKFKV